MKWVNHLFTHFFYSMEQDRVLEVLKEELAPLLNEMGAETVEFTLKRKGKNLVLRLLVDKREGIKLNECTIINQRIGEIVDAKALINERYLLEVSSPGLDRPLKNRRDFERAHGREVTIFLLKPIEGRNFLAGIIKMADDNNVVIECAETKEVSIPYDVIAKARLNIKF